MRILVFASRQALLSSYFSFSSNFLLIMAAASDLKADRRVVKCPGCKTPSEDHHWGIPSKFCGRFEKSSPKKEMETSPTSETVFSALAAELESSELEEEELRRQEEESKLRKRITDKRKLIERLPKSGSGDAATPTT